VPTKAQQNESPPIVEVNQL